MSLGERLYELRKSKNLSQEQVAEQLNVTRQTVSKWETDESKPDFDKIVPICNLYGISTEELLTDNKLDEVIKEEVIDNIRDDNKKKRAIYISLGILIYFLSIIYIILGATTFNFDDGILAAGFLLFVGIGTCIMVYQGVVLSEKKEKTELEKKQDTAEEIVAGIFAVIYFLVSFLTMAWHITWIIWIICGVVVEIVKVIISMKENKKYE